jgi:hypothetical protein
MSVSFECCVPIPRSEESYGLWCVTVCDLEASMMRRPWPALGCCAGGKKKIIYRSVNNLFCRRLHACAALSREHIRRCSPPRLSGYLPYE